KEAAGDGADDQAGGAVTAPAIKAAIAATIDTVVAAHATLTMAPRTIMPRRIPRAVAITLPAPIMARLRPGRRSQRQGHGDGGGQQHCGEMFHHGDGLSSMGGATFLEARGSWRAELVSCLCLSIVRMAATVPGRKPCILVTFTIRAPACGHLRKVTTGYSLL